MTAVAYTQWLPAVQIHVPECPTPMITEAVRSTCIRFCGESRYLREELDPFNTVATDEEYEIAAPADCAIAEILSLRVDGTQLKPTTVDALENEVVDWQDLTGRPTRYFQRSRAVIVMNPVPDAAYVSRAVVAIKPSQSSGGVDERVFEEWKDAIASGALAYLMAMPGQAWSNPELAGYHGGLFSSAVSRARNQADAGYSLTRPSRVRARFL